MENKKQQIAYLNYVRVFAAFAVVFLHVLAQGANICEKSCFSFMELFVLRLLRNSLNWCVPVFVMITGVLFLDPEKDTSIKKLFVKYISRFVLVILTFGTVYCFIEIVFEEREFTMRNFLIAIKNTLTGKCWDAMWYLYMVIGLYILLPILKKLVENISKELLSYTLIVLFIFSSIIPYINQFIFFDLRFPNISIYIFYILLGYAVEYGNFKMKKTVSIVSIVLYLMYLSVIQLNERYIIMVAEVATVGYDSPFVVLTSLGLFSLCKKIKRESKVVNFLSSLTFGVYILHTVSTNVCYRLLRLTAENYSVFVSFTVTAGITIVMSLSVTYCLKLIPFVRKYIL